MTNHIIDGTPEPIPEQSEQVKSIVNQLAILKKQLQAIHPEWYNVALIQNNLSIRNALVEQLFSAL